MNFICRVTIGFCLGLLAFTGPAEAQFAPSALDGSQGLRPANTLPSTSNPTMVPLSPTRSLGFDPYSSSQSGLSGYGSLSGMILPQSNTLAPQTALQPPSVPFNYSAPISNPYGVYPSAPSSPLGGLGSSVYPSYTGPSPILPGAGQSAIIQTNPAVLPNGYASPSVLPNSTPSALFPGSYGGSSPGLFGGLFGGSTSSPYAGFGGAAPGYGYNGATGGGYNWNPQGSMFSGQYGQFPEFIRLFQGPRIRHGYVHGNNAFDDLSINDTDVAIAMLWPNFGFSTQPIYILPSFSLHQWAGPRPDLSPTTNADLPSKAYSAFIDTGWQSDPNRILGAEVGVRVGVFSDFETLTNRSLRIMGRGIGRIRLTPQATFKVGVMYLDRNRVKILPAGGLLWQPNPTTRMDLFFPEPKLSAFMTTLGNVDTWWYVGGYYGGGAWTVKRTDGTKDSIDINDIRIVLGLEWGRNDMMRDGRRMGFAEIGYVFDRELLYRARPADNLKLNDSFMLRVGIGY